MIHLIRDIWHDMTERSWRNATFWLLSVGIVVVCIVK